MIKINCIVSYRIESSSSSSSSSLITMTLPMHNRRPHPAASRGGSNAAAMRHQQQQQQQNQQRRHIAAAGNSNAPSGGNEGIVQKLQGVIAAIRGDRNREHRNRDIAMEKLRSAKEAFHQDKATLQADKDKYIATQNVSENTQKEILIIEKSIQELQQKVRIGLHNIISKRYR
jgi:histone deacetylase complex regulatory component SIN3